MKRVFTIFTALLLITLCQSCKKGAELFKGEYSYKTTGVVYLGWLGADEISESGQLRVSKTGTDNVVLMFQPIIGDIFYLRGTAKNDSVFVESDSITRKYTVLVTDYTLKYKITGKGCMHDNTILLKSHVNGRIVNNDTQKTPITISSEEIVTMANRNK